MERTKRISSQTLAIAILTLLLVASILMTATGAWFTSTGGDTDDGMTFGTITLSPIGANFGYTLGEPTPAKPDVLMPGDTVTVTFTVANGGTADMWTRFKLEIGGDGESVFAVAFEDQEVSNYIFNEGDGYFYRNTPSVANLDLEGSTTDPITLTFYVDPALIDDTFEGHDVTFSLVVEAVQAANNGANGPAALGWPTHEFE